MNPIASTLVAVTALLAPTLSTAALGAQHASYTYRGTSCGIAELTATSLPRLGHTLHLRVQGATSTHFSGGLLLTGIHPIVPPIDMKVLFGRAHCTISEPGVCGELHLHPLVTQGVPGIGQVTMSFPIPNDSALHGAHFYQQNIHWVQPPGIAFCAVMSRAGVGTVGT